MRDIDAVTKTYDYDAANRMSSYFYYVNPTTSVIDFEDYETMSYSGDNQLVKVATTHDPTEGDTETDATYQIRSSVLGGQTISKADKTGAKIQTYIIAAGAVVAGTFWDNSAIWSHKDPNTDSIRSTTASGSVVGSDDDFGSHELDASGRSVGFTNPYSSDPQWDNIPDLYQAQQSYGSMINGMPAIYKGYGGLTIPKKLYDDMMEFSFGSIFGLLEQHAIASRGQYIGTTYSVSSRFGNQEFGGDAASADSWWVETHGQLNVKNTYAISDSSWAVNLSTVPFDYIQLGPVELTRVGVEMVTTGVSNFLNRNDSCKAFINSLLTQLAKDQNVKLEPGADVNAYLSEFAKNGNIEASLLVSTNGSNVTGAGELKKGNWGDSGYGIIGAFTAKWADKKVNLTWERNSVLFLHEFIHLIGQREGKSKFSDVNVAKAMENMGIAVSVEEFIKRSKTNNEGPRAAGQLWDEILHYKCGTVLPGTPKPHGLK